MLTLIGNLRDACLMVNGLTVTIATTKCAPANHAELLPSILGPRDQRLTNFLLFYENANDIFLSNSKDYERYISWPKHLGTLKSFLLDLGLDDSYIVKLHDMKAQYIRQASWQYAVAAFTSTLSNGNFLMETWQVTGHSENLHTWRHLIEPNK
uniref:Uncharacterized protein n=1 Tax=Glossina austeni TaxID=7395 RepID=A0A1A9UL61_GLOAU